MSDTEPERPHGGVLPSNVGSSSALAAAAEPTWRAMMSPWLVGLLVFATFNLYALWWLGRTWWQIKQEDGDAGKRPVWHALSMFVPIYGYFRYHAHMRTIVHLGTTPDAKAALSPTAMTIAWIVINALSGFALDERTPLWLPILAAVLSACLFGWAQFGLNTVWASRPGTTTSARVHPLHIALLVLGFTLYGLSLVSIS